MPENKRLASGSTGSVPAPSVRKPEDTKGSVAANCGSMNAYGGEGPSAPWDRRPDWSNRLDGNRRPPGLRAEENELNNWEQAAWRLERMSLGGIRRTRQLRADEGAGSGSDNYSSTSYEASTSHGSFDRRGEPLNLMDSADGSDESG